MGILSQPASKQASYRGIWLILTTNLMKTKMVKEYFLKNRSPISPKSPKLSFWQVLKVELIFVCFTLKADIEIGGMMMAIFCQIKKIITHIQTIKREH